MELAFIVCTFTLFTYTEGFYLLLLASLFLNIKGTLISQYLNNYRITLRYILKGEKGKVQQTTGQRDYAQGEPYFSFHEYAFGFLIIYNFVGIYRLSIARLEHSHRLLSACRYHASYRPSTHRHESFHQTRC